MAKGQGKEKVVVRKFNDGVVVGFARTRRRMFHPTERKTRDLIFHPTMAWSSWSIRYWPEHDRIVVSTGVNDIEWDGNAHLTEHTERLEAIAQWYQLCTEELARVQSQQKAIGP